MISVNEFGHFTSYRGVEMVRRECEESGYNSIMISIWIPLWTVWEYHRVVRGSDVSVLGSTHLLGRWLTCLCYETSE